MITKLTLTIDDSVIVKAKKYAKSKQNSLSGIIENYLKALVNESNEEEKGYSPIVKSLKSSFHYEENFDYKKSISKVLSEKYL